MYLEATNQYFTELKTKNAKDIDKIDWFINAINFNSLVLYDLASTQKVILVDVENNNIFENATKIKTIFFLIDNKIVQSKIITFENSISYNDYDKMILAILNRTSKEKLHYSGKISIYNALQNKLLSSEYSNGLTIKSSSLSIKSKKAKTAKTNGCTDWYWVTNYADGRQTNEYLYTTCDGCEEMPYKSLNACGGGSGTNVQTTSIFPVSPIDNAIVNYFSPEGEHIKYQYVNGIWKIILISLPDIVIKTVRESRPYLIFDWPQDKQKVVAEGFVYTYDSESGNWEGISEEIIAQAIEDNIDDSLLDPCLKEIMHQLKNVTNNDVANILNNLGANSIYNIKMVMKPAATYAETQPMSKYNYEIRFDRDQYINGTKLFKATVLIHEIIHAYFLSIVDDYNYTPSTALPSFPELFEVYVLKTNPDSNNKEDAQHKAMADKYVAAMASALQAYDANYTVTYQVYEDLAWGALSAAPIFNKTYPSGSTENIRIQNRYAAEAVGFTIGSGTPQEQTPIGKLCN